MADIIDITFDVPDPWIRNGCTVADARRSRVSLEVKRAFRDPAFRYAGIDPDAPCSR
jgi:hypothetical protein